VILAEEVVGIDIVEGPGNGGVYCRRSHSEKLVSWCVGKEERVEKDASKG